MGPPLVSTCTVSNTWNERIAEITTTNRVTGPSIGQVTRWKRDQRAFGAVDRGRLVEIASGSTIEAGHETAPC